MMTRVTTLTPVAQPVLRVPHWREVLVAMQYDRGVAMVAIVAGAVVAVAVVAGLCVVAVLSGDVGVGAVGLGLGSLATIAVNAWRNRRPSDGGSS